jgi:ArsR family transcriptional regulator
MILAMMIDADALVQALADRTRLKALVLLTRESSLCVCELTAALDVSQPKMSRHLAALRALDIVEDARLANRVFYRLHPELPGWALGVLHGLAEGMVAASGFAAVQRRLHEFPNRPRQRAAFVCGSDLDRDRKETAHAV